MRLAHAQFSHFVREVDREQITDVPNSRAQTVYQVIEENAIYKIKIKLIDKNKQGFESEPNRKSENTLFLLKRKPELNRKNIGLFSNMHLQYI